MKYEIRFLLVGNGKKGSDAILVRLEESKDNYKVMVVVGGTKESNEKTVDHIKTFYGTTHVANTHSDQDHSSGLFVA